MTKRKWKWIGTVALLVGIPVAAYATNLTSIGVTSGVPNSGTGTVSTIDALMADGGQVTIGAKADTAWSSGAGSVVAILKAIATNSGLPAPAGTNVIGKVGIDQTTPGTTNLVSAGQNGTWNVGRTSQYPAGATAITASATGTTAATTATLAATTGKTTYICSLSIRSNATAAATGNATVTGTITGTMNYTHWTAPLASGVGVTEQVFAPCVPASTTNTAIAVVSPAPGSGGVVSVSATGYQL